MKEILKEYEIINPKMVSDGYGEFPDTYKLGKRHVNEIVELIKKELLGKFEIYAKYVDGNQNPLMCYEDFEELLTPDSEPTTEERVKRDILDILHKNDLGVRMSSTTELAQFNSLRDDLFDLLKQYAQSKPIDVEKLLDEIINSYERVTTAQSYDKDPDGLIYNDWREHSLQLLKRTLTQQDKPTTEENKVVDDIIQILQEHDITDFAVTADIYDYIESITKNNTKNE